MHIEKFTVCGRSYLRLVRSKRRLTRNGKPISGKEPVLGLGPLSRHDDGKPDYLHFLRIARGSAYELETQLVLAEDLGLCAQAASSKVVVTLQEVIRVLQGLIAALERRVEK